MISLSAISNSPGPNAISMWLIPTLQEFFSGFSAPPNFPQVRQIALVHAHFFILKSHIVAALSATTTDREAQGWSQGGIRHGSRLQHHWNLGRFKQVLKQSSFSAQPSPARCRRLAGGFFGRFWAPNCSFWNSGRRDSEAEVVIDQVVFICKRIALNRSNRGVYSGICPDLALELLLLS